MGGSSISVDVRAANGKLAGMLRSREEEEALLQIGKRRIRDQAGGEERRHRRGKSLRWATPADFSYPSPLVDRPRTADGATSFHFDYRTITKEGSPTLRGTPLEGFGGVGKTPGADHAVYVERAGAAERSRGAEHAGYIEREGAVELATSGLGEAVSNHPDSVGETLLPDEKALLGPVEWKAVKSVFSNISEDRFEREDYWRAVHRRERTAKAHSIIPDPSASPRWWREIGTWPGIPEEFRGHCLAELRRYQTWLKNTPEPGRTPFVPAPFRRAADPCGEALNAALRVPGWDPSRPPVRFKSGSGGKVQIRFVAELPHELTPEDRALITRNFCDHLATFARDENGKTIGLMYTAVIHAPDAHNDRRNYHLHVIAHDRPAEWLPEYQMWDFEVAEVFDHRGETRTRYPFRQNKIGEVERKLADGNKYKHAHYNNAIAGGDFIPSMRAKFAEITNDVLAARGVQRRLDPRTYEKMGIERTPTRHLGTNAAALEAVGVPTIVGQLNAIAIWNDAERTIRNRAAAVDAALKGAQRNLRAFVSDAIETDPRAPETRPLRILMAEREGLIEHVASDRLELMIFDHLEAKAKSRAVRTMHTCRQTLAEADRDPGSHTSKLIGLVRQRFEEARSHIAEVDRELEGDRATLDEAAKDVVRREDRIRAIDSRLALLRESFTAGVEKERRRREREEQRRLDAAALVQTPAFFAPHTAEAPVTAEEVIPSRPLVPATDAAQDRVPRSTPNLLAIVANLRFPSGQTTQSSRTLHAIPTIAKAHRLVGSRLKPDATSQPTATGRLHQTAPGEAPRDPRVLASVNAEADGGDHASPIESMGRAIQAVQPSVTSPAMVPPAIDGVPIVEPTIPHEGDAITPVVRRSSGTPAGPNPVRASDKAPNFGAGPAAVEGGFASPAAHVVDPTGPPSPRESVPPTSSPSSPQSSMRAQTSGAISSVGQDAAVAHVSASKRIHKQWDELLARISRERIRVVGRTGKAGRVHYEVPDLCPSDQDLLLTERFEKRLFGRLKAIYDLQAAEVARLVAWISERNKDPKHLVFEGKAAQIERAPKAIGSLMRNWGEHPHVIAALQKEYKRRQTAETLQAELRRCEEQARSSALRAIEGVPSGTTSLSPLAASLPAPEDAATPQVRLFIELLRSDATASEIRAAAERIRVDPVAREDVHRHRFELAHAYDAAISDDEEGQIVSLFGRRGAVQR